MNNHCRAECVAVGLAILLSLAGCALSAVLLQHHVSIELGTNPIFEGVCAPVDSASCDAVLATEYAMMAGQPTALWGLFFFVATASWFIVVGQAHGSRRWLRPVLVLATAAGTIDCAYLAFVMWTRLEKWCPLCAATHIITAALFVVTLWLWRQRARPAAAAEAGPLISGQVAGPVECPSFRLVLAAVLLAGVACLAGWATYHGALQKGYADAYRKKLEQYDKKWEEYAQRCEEYESSYREACERFSAEPQVDIPIGPDDPVRGSANAPHTVIVFSDFQCPYCRVLDLLIRKRLKEFPGQFRVVYKHTPMNKECNQYASKTLHGGSCAAAITAEAARLVAGNEAFWKMHDELFDHQKEFASGAQPFVKEAAARIGIDHDELWKRVRSRSAWDRIHENVEQAHVLEVKATPVMYFDGRKMTGWGDKPLWTYLLRMPPATRPATPTSSAASRPSTAGP